MNKDKGGENIVRGEDRNRCVRKKSLLKANEFWVVIYYELANILSVGAEAVKIPLRDRR